MCVSHNVATPHLYNHAATHTHEPAHTRLVQHTSQHSAHCHVHPRSKLVKFNSFARCGPKAAAPSASRAVPATTHTPHHPPCASHRVRVPPSQCNENHVTTHKPHIRPAPHATTTHTTPTPTHNTAPHSTTKRAASRTCQIQAGQTRQLRQRWTHPRRTRCTETEF